MVTTGVPPRMILSLYREIVRKGEQTLVLTDLEFFRRKVRSEFEAGRRELKPENVSLLFQAGKRFASKLGGLL
ncbi:mitochondrial Complex1_LYR family protein [Andalucia godoyi]|uniref:Mitochondrial Complex1_LYR family protein n=1 Tax=Andalucia godoyi TaxID=505711 RepID=A0A8K0AHK6_ANDGO|nr:mitochondrial Complex1_LYR family protein [Andalucia godoyi]|eukprot:ANDGO_08808.mRNA.1 mitochondrial Complex1_LYR family protein